MNKKLLCLGKLCNEISLFSYFTTFYNEITLHTFVLNNGQIKLQLTHINFLFYVRFFIWFRQNLIPTCRPRLPSVKHNFWSSKVLAFCYPVPGKAGLRRNTFGIILRFRRSKMRHTVCNFSLCRHHRHRRHPRLPPIIRPVECECHATVWVVRAVFVNCMQIFCYRSFKFITLVTICAS